MYEVVYTCLLSGEIYAELYICEADALRAVNSCAWSDMLIEVNYIQRKE